MSSIILVPTSHVAEESLRNVKAAIEKEKPDCVAVELDKMRLMAMKEGGGLPPVKELGLGTFLVFWSMKKIQEWLGKKVGILPGSEMLKAIEAAKSRGIPVAFIDRNIVHTMSGIKSVSSMEKLKLLFLLVKGVTFDAFSREKIDLAKIPPEEMIDAAMDFLRVELPGFYKVLVEERNRYMASRLLHLAKHYKKIVAVVGAGHAKGMRQLLA